VFHAAGSRVRFGLLDGAWVDVAALHLSSCTHVALLPLSFIVHYYIFYPRLTVSMVRHIAKRLRPLFVGGAIQIPVD